MSPDWCVRSFEIAVRPRLGGNATRGALRSSSLWLILRYGRSVLELKITFRSDKMAACLKRFGIGIIGALSIFGAQLTAMSPA